MATTTPKEINDTVLAFCGSIVQGGRSVFVPVHFDKEAFYGECFLNVEAKVKSCGGAEQYGWTIWEDPGLLLEAEFHAVWLRPDGTFLDVTPHEGEGSILFLPDPVARWEKQFIPNRRLPLTEDSRLLEYIDLANRADAPKTAAPDGRIVTPLKDVLPTRLRQLQLLVELGITVNLPDPAHVRPPRLAELTRSPKERAEERKKARRRGRS